MIIGSFRLTNSLGVACMDRWLERGWGS